MDPSNLVLRKTIFLLPSRLSLLPSRPATPDSRKRRSAARGAPRLLSRVRRPNRSRLVVSTHICCFISPALTSFPAFCVAARFSQPLPVVFRIPNARGSVTMTGCPMPQRQLSRSRCLRSYYAHRCIEGVA